MFYIIHIYNKALSLKGIDYEYKAVDIVKGDQVLKNLFIKSTNFFKKHILIDLNTI